jgi:hypothetical protein
VRNFITDRFFAFKLTLLRPPKCGSRTYEALSPRDAVSSTNQPTTFVNEKKETIREIFLCVSRDVFRARRAQNRTGVLWRVARTAAMLMRNTALSWN